MKKTYLTKGFTLIELLVVIAIIGILSSVVLASLNSARSKGNDAAVKSNLANLRPQAELYYDSSGTYGVFAVNACAATAGTIFADTTVQGQILAAAKAGGSNTSTLADANCVSSASGWAVNVALKSPTNTGGRWCVDGTGAAKEVVVAGADRGFTGVACK